MIRLLLKHRDLFFLFLQIDIDDDSMENKKEKDVEVTAITCDDVDKVGKQI